MIQNDYLNQSTGHPRAYSKRFDYPYLDAGFQPVDPRPLTLYDTISITVEIDGRPTVFAYTTGPSDNVETALVALAQQIDAFHPGVHAFSALNVISVQALPPTTVVLRAVHKTPYRLPAASFVLLDPPGEPFGTTMNVTITRAGATRLFSAPLAVTAGRTVSRLCDVVSSDVWLKAEPTAAGGMLIHGAVGSGLVSSAIYYG